MNAYERIVYYQRQVRGALALTFFLCFVGLLMLGDHPVWGVFLLAGSISWALAGMSIAWQRYRPLGPAFEDAWQCHAGPEVVRLLAPGRPQLPAEERLQPPRASPVFGNALNMFGVDLPIRLALAVPGLAINAALAIENLMRRRQHEAELRRHALARLHLLHAEYKHERDRITAPQQTGILRSRYRSHRLARVDRHLQLTVDAIKVFTQQEAKYRRRRGHHANDPEARSHDARSQGQIEA